MRIIDWSSDVCSSDLLAAVFAKGGDDDIVRVLAKVEALGRFLMEEDGGNLLVAYRRANNIVRAEMKKTPELTLGAVDGQQIGRASCRERVCQDVAITVVAVSLKKNKYKSHIKNNKNIN